MFQGDGNLVRMARKPFSADEVQFIINEYATGRSQKDIATALGRKQGNIARVLRRSGVQAKRRGPYRTHSLDENFFSVIDTEEKAYWLGFISADGNVQRSPDGRQVWLGVELHRRDRGHLIKLATSLGSDVTPRDRINNNGVECSSVRFHSQRLVDDLGVLGVVPNKTFSLQPWSGSPELMRHYWRGFVDGDGCLYVGSRHLALQLVGTEAVVDSFRQHMLTTNPNLTVVPQPTKSPGIVQISYYGSASPKLLVTHLYRNATVFLERKAELAIRFMEG